MFIWNVSYSVVYLEMHSFPWRKKARKNERVAKGWCHYDLNPWASMGQHNGTPNGKPLTQMSLFVERFKCKFIRWGGWHNQKS